MALHTKYRPNQLKDLIGHEEITTRLQGLIKKVQAGERCPSLLFVGPTSAGKTTTARAFANDLNNDPNFCNTNECIEINVGDNRSIEDMRELTRISKYRSLTGKKRVIILDEVQALVGPALECILKYIEEPEKDVVWILCSMDPQKFKTGKYRALANRCTQFCLEPHTEKDLAKQAARIIRSENMTYMKSKELVKQIISHCNGEMRTLAQLIESCQQYYEGLEEKPDMLTVETLSEVISTSETQEETLAINIIAALYHQDYQEAVASIMQTTDTFALTKAIARLNSYILYTTCSKEKSSKVWHSSANLQAKKLVGKLATVDRAAKINQCLAEALSKMTMFAMDADLVLTSALYTICQK